MLPFKLDGHFESHLNLMLLKIQIAISVIVKVFLHRNLLDHELRTIKAKFQELLTFQSVTHGCRESRENNRKGPDDVTCPLMSFRHPWSAFESWSTNNA